MTNPIPAHVAIIMDGNGRWAAKRRLPRVRGHQAGADRVIETIREASDAGVKYLTLYSFSKENWQRPEAEVNFLMGLLSDYLDKKIEEIKRNNMVFNTIGEINDLPEAIQKKIEKSQEETRANTGMTITFAFSYSSRFEITRACRRIAEKVKAGEIEPERIDEALLSAHMYTAGLPDPDLLIRTSGELRISNFLLWQISYAELYMTDTFWPDFGREEFNRALEAYAKRERRFGLTGPPPVEKTSS